MTDQVLVVVGAQRLVRQFALFLLLDAVVARHERRGPHAVETVATRHALAAATVLPW